MHGKHNIDKNLNLSTESAAYGKIHSSVPVAITETLNGNF